jgi:hypothetical protein
MATLQTDSVAMPGTLAGRLARGIVAASTLEIDPKTVRCLARHIGMSTRSFSEMCALLSLKPSDVRDLTRLLRLVAKRNECIGAVEWLLDIADRRTLRRLLSRACVTRDELCVISKEDFLSRQRLIDTRHPVVQALRWRYLSSGCDA